MTNALVFNVVDNNTFSIETSQQVSPDELCNRISAMEMKKANFKMQIELGRAQIERQTKMEEQLSQAIAEIESDLVYAYDFLKNNNQEELIAKIEAKVQENEKTLVAMKNQAMQEQ